MLVIMHQQRECQSMIEVLLLLKIVRWLFLAGCFRCGDCSLQIFRVAE